MSIIGLDVGGSKTAVVEGTRDGTILQRAEIPTHAEQPFDVTFPEIASLVERTIDASSAQKRTVEAISVSIGGPLKIESGEILNPPHLPGWHDVPLSKHLGERFPNLPNYVEHDGNAGALAEFRFGAGASINNVKHLIFLTFGTGLGAGIIVNGSVLRGASDTAGEVGHWRLKETGPVGFSKAGSWEGLASGTAMLQLAQRRFPHKWGKEATVRSFVGAVLDGDLDGLSVVEEIGMWLGRGIALLVDALNPQLVVLGRLASVLGERVLAPLRAELAREALPQAAAAVEVVPCRLGDALGDVASLMAAINQFNDGAKP
jgi:glucokinase